MSAVRHDVVVVGAGPAGLAAATAAASRGRTVLVLDMGARPGGQIWRHREGDMLPRRARIAIEAARAAGVTFASESSVVDADGPGRLVIERAGGLEEASATSLVLATGAVERLMPFPGWTLPGVVGVGGLQALVKGGLALAGKRVVLSGTGPLLLPVAAAAARDGAHVTVLEQQPFVRVAAFGLRAILEDTSRLGDLVRYRTAARGAAWHHDAWVGRAEGGERVERAVLRIGGREVTVPCDWLGAAAGLAPRTDFARLLGCALDGDAVAVDLRQATSVPGVFAAGECTGVKGDTAGEIEGTIAGAAAAGDDGPSRSLATAMAAGRVFGARLARAFAPRAELWARVTPDTIVCRCEDVPAGALGADWSSRQAKLWTRAGMGVCQGTVCGLAGAGHFRWSPGSTRSPLGTPPLGAWAATLCDTTHERQEGPHDPR
jgi:NADPH-dependent 2,4-dienoyl-CoA reductase/sulfur reductase-like enzyme